MCKIIHPTEENSFYTIIITISFIYRLKTLGLFHKHTWQIEKNYVQNVDREGLVHKQKSTIVIKPASINSLFD